MLASALWRNIGHGAFQHFQQGLLNAFAGDVASNTDVLAGLANLIDFVDEDDARVEQLRCRSLPHAAV
jgi:hypothetical protein